MKTYRLTTAGFTLIETLMAILVLTVAIAGPLTIASRGLNEALVAKDQTIAFYLAQDAVEFVRYQRDTNVLQSNAWLTGLDSCEAADGCTVLSISDTIGACSGICPVLNYDKSLSVYTYNSIGGTVIPTIFTRTVHITTPVSGSAVEAQVEVDVTWSDVGTVLHKVSVQENLFNWQ